MGHRRLPTELGCLVGSKGSLAHTKCPETCATGESARAGPTALMVETNAADSAAIMRKVERKDIVLLLFGRGDGLVGSGCGPPGSAGEISARAAEPLIAHPRLVRSSLSTMMRPGSAKGSAVRRSAARSRPRCGVNTSCIPVH